MSMKIPPLTCKTESGKPYQRRPDVEAEIERVLGLPQSLWVAEAKGLHSETLAFLIRHPGYPGDSIVGRLLQELLRRTVRIAGRWARGFDQYDTEEIVRGVEKTVFSLVIDQVPSARSEFLEVAFAKAVARHTHKAVRSHKNSMSGHLTEMVVDRRANDGIENEAHERPIELAADTGPSPEVIFLQLEDSSRLRQGLDAIKDPFQRLAVMLRYAHGWQIESKDPKKMDLARLLHKTPRAIRYLLKTGVETVREAMGVNND